jgi:SNF2 family DNA or RNA helicase
MSVELFKFQRSALEQTKPFNHVAYYLDMGLGKTFVGSEKLIDLGCQVNLLICQKSKIKDWIDHFKINYPDYIVYDLTNKDALTDFQFKVELKPKIGVINYELTFRRSQLLGLKNFTLKLDESSMIQNENTKRSKFVLKLKPDNVILLSGTPTSGKYENLWSQLHLLGWDIKKETFWTQYVETVWVEDNEGHFRKDVIGYKNVDRLKRKLAEHGAIFMTTDEAGIELPEQIIVPVMVDPSKEYIKFNKKRLITINTKSGTEFKDDSDFFGNDVTPRVELVGDSALTKLLYSRMLCGQYNQEKLEAFKDLINSTSDRLIVFYNFNAELEKLTAICKYFERPLSIMNGQVKDLIAYENQADSVTFVQYQAGSMGLNLQKANKTIYFTLPLSAEQFIQSHKRTHRIGQKNTCFYYYMMCRDSVEEDILDTLKMRKDYTDALFTDYEGKKK